MQIILNDREIVVIHDALMKERDEVERRMSWHDKESIRHLNLKKEFDELNTLVKRFEPYAK